MRKNLFLLVLLVASIIATPVLAQDGQNQNQVEECPTDREMWVSLGLTEVTPVFVGEGIEWDSCHWQWQANDVLDEGISLRIPTYWQATTSNSDGEIEVWRGPIRVNNVIGFDLRYTPAYTEDHWVQDDCSLLAQETAFGLRRDPWYLTLNGNLNCEPLEEFDPEVCPTSQEEIAALIGGEPSMWTEPDWELGAWTFSSGDEENFILLQVPMSLKSAEEIVRIDYWNAQSIPPGPDTLTADDRGISLPEASFHCHAAEE